MELGSLRGVERDQPEIVQTWVTHHCQSPLPLPAIEFVWWQGVRQQSIFAGWGSGPEGAFPSLAWRPIRGDNQATGFNAEVDRIAETTLIDDGLWNPDTTRVTDTNQGNFHKIRCDYIVGTLERAVVWEPRWTGIP